MANDTAELSLSPSNLTNNIPVETRSAEIQGVLLSSLTQVAGFISENIGGNNVYDIELTFGGGGFESGGGNPDPFIGFVISSEELVETQVDEGEDPVSELRPTILILSATPAAASLDRQRISTSSPVSGIMRHILKPGLHLLSSNRYQRQNKQVWMT